MARVTDEFTGDEVEGTQTAFNSALDIIQRVSRLKYTLHSNLIFENLTAAFNILREYITVIDFKMTDEERVEVYEVEMELRGDLKKAEEVFYYNGAKYFKEPKLREQVKERLIEMARVLGRIEYRTGMGMIDKDDPRFALSQE